MNVLSNVIDALNECNYGRSYDDIEAAPNIITITTELTKDRQSVAIIDFFLTFPKSGNNC